MPFFYPPKFSTFRCVFVSFPRIVVPLSCTVVADVFEDLATHSVRSSLLEPAAEYSNSILYLYTVLCVFASPLIVAKKTCEVD